jgi:hypothetical protein
MKEKKERPSHFGQKWYSKMGFSIWGPKAVCQGFSTSLPEVTCSPCFNRHVFYDNGLNKEAEAGKTSEI